jgi:hypothetical protein
MSAESLCKHTLKWKNNINLSSFSYERNESEEKHIAGCLSRFWMQPFRYNSKPALRKIAMRLGTKACKCSNVDALVNKRVKPLLWKVFIIGKKCQSRKACQILLYLYETHLHTLWINIITKSACSCYETSKTFSLMHIVWFDLLYLPPRHHINSEVKKML